MHALLSDWKSGIAFVGGLLSPLLAWIASAAILVLCSVTYVLRGRLEAEKMATAVERRRREEMEAYERLDPALTTSMAAGLNPVETSREMAKQVCRTITEFSAFHSAAMLLKNAEGKLYCAGSSGVDDLTLVALQGWGDQAALEETIPSAAHMQIRPVSRSRSFEAAKAGARALAAHSNNTGVKSFTIPLGAYENFDPEVSNRRMEGLRERRRSRRCIIAPLRTANNRLVGAIALFADDSSRSARTRMAVSDVAECVTGPVEALASKLATAIENCAMAERLLRAEKLAGLGQLAGGVAHALNNPLTAVLGFAELIEETSQDARVQRDARTIRAEARKMRETVQSLMNFWRPSTLSEESVQVDAVIRELAEACTDKLRERGIALELSMPDELPTVRGSSDRLRLVFEHLLNNAAQAIAQPTPMYDEDEIHAIRINVTCDPRTLNIIVSDTGPGFRDPTRVFDPFYTTRPPGEGAGLGLSICYGVVREHSGEITAFNLHPHGAAVVIELPIRRSMNTESGSDSASIPTERNGLRIVS